MRQDPLAAVAATETLPKNPGRGRLEAARVVIDTWFEQEGTADPTPILGLLNQLELKPRARGISRMIHALIETRGLDGAEAFVLAIPSDFEHLGTSLKQEAMSRLAAELLDYDVARAVRWADQQGQGRENAGVRRHLAHYWATRDGPAAMEWALSLPDDTERRVVVKRAWLSFRRTQPEAAAEWLLAQEPNRTLLVIFSRYITSIAKDDPEGAIAIAERAQDPKIRRQLYVAVGKGWMRADPEAAQAWIDEVGLTPAQQQQIRRWAGMENPPPKTG